MIEGAKRGGAWRADVVVASPVWSLNGVNVFSANLVRGLRAEGVRASILLTQPDQYDPKPMPFPADVPVERLDVGRGASWPGRWRAMAAYLEDRAPCIYVPNYDMRHSCVSPTLSDGVAIVGIVHSDDPQHYEHVTRLGRYWNAVVAVSREVARRTVELAPDVERRLTRIPYGVRVRERAPERTGRDGTLRLVYAGRLVQEQKRILDLPRIVAAALERGTRVELTVIGDGPDRGRLERASAELIARGSVRLTGTLPNAAVLDEFEHGDVFVATSEYEGLSVSLLEAMGRGCVPVVTDVRSGVRECVRDGESGFLVGVGDVAGFAARLAELASDASLRNRMAEQAYEAVVREGYRIEDMVARYVELFGRVLREVDSGAFRRPVGPILPPPSLTWRDRVSESVRAAIRRSGLPRLAHPE